MYLKKLTLATLAALPFLAANSQPPAPRPRVDKSEEIVIRKKGDKVEKMTVVIDGDNVTINGKPVDKFENKDVIIMKRNGSDDVIGHPRVMAFGGPGPMALADGDFDAPGVKKWYGADNKKTAFLGVVTEKADDGVKITQVTKESAAEKAGLKEGDVITKIGSASITTPDKLSEAIRSYKPNDKVDISYKRNGKENKASTTLGESKMRAYTFKFDSDDFNMEMPELDHLMWKRPRIGLQIQDLEEGKGVKVEDVDDDSPASRAGLKEGDVITTVNGKEIEGVDEMKNEMKNFKEGDTVKLSYKRNGSVESADVKIPKKIKTADL